jgi:hypothetical protein
MAKFEVLHKMQSFKLVDGKFKAYTLVTVRLSDGKVVSFLLPYPEHLVTNKEIEEELRKRKLI